ncbi:MAG: hypothetical protein WKG07_04630 [Hymenobacter sp.]
MYRNWLGPLLQGLPPAQGRGQAGGADFRVDLLHEEARQGALFFLRPHHRAGQFWAPVTSCWASASLALGYHRACSDGPPAPPPAAARDTTQKQLFKPIPHRLRRERPLQPALRPHHPRPGDRERPAALHPPQHQPRARVDYFTQRPTRLRRSSKPCLTSPG